MGVKIEVEFSQKEKIYFPGQTVRCFIHLKVTSKTKVRCISALISGTAETLWQKKERRYRERHAKLHNYTGLELIISANFVLFGQHNGPKVALEPGSSMLYGPIEVQLPYHIPPTFYDKYGAIRYEVKVIMSTSSPKTYVTPFFVRSMLNLNTFPELGVPKALVESSEIGCCGFCKRPIQITLFLPRSGFVPGDTVPLHLVCCNKSPRKTVTKLKVTLLNRIGCMSTYPRQEQRTTETILAMAKFKTHIRPGEQQTVHGEIQLSENVPLRIVYGSQLIRSFHVLQVTTSVSGFGNDFVAEIPIVIGNFPLMEPTAPVLQAANEPLSYDKVILSHLPVNIPPSAPPIENDDDQSVSDGEESD